MSNHRYYDCLHFVYDYNFVYDNLLIWKNVYDYNSVYNLFMTFLFKIWAQSRQYYSLYKMKYPIALSTVIHLK